MREEIEHLKSVGIACISVIRYDFLFQSAV
jgi:hypothetical protein